ncbi:MAG: hypothetical protein H6741_03825 [Alphaproteobacteria bacterium]|nr:hypothetical protein [Alphaproteobacteria bacterium]
MLGLGLQLGAAWALTAKDELDLTLVAGGEVRGYFYACHEGALSLTSDGALTRVNLSLVEAAQVDGAAMPLDLLRAEVEACYEERIRAATDPNVRRPPPLAVGAASALWPGAGHAMLGDWGTALGYSLVELGLIGAASYWLIGQDQPGPIIPIIALDLVFRTYSVADSSREARRRRQVALTPMSGGGAGLWVSLNF